MSSLSPGFTGQVWFDLTSSAGVLERGLAWLFLQTTCSLCHSEIISFSFVTFWTWAFFFLSFFFLFSVQEMSKLALLDHPAPQRLSLKSTEPFLNWTVFSNIAVHHYSYDLPVCADLPGSRRTDLSNQIRNPAWKHHLLKQGLTGSHSPLIWCPAGVGLLTTVFQIKFWFSCHTILSANDLRCFFLPCHGLIKQCGVGEWKNVSLSEHL